MNLWTTFVTFVTFIGIVILVTISAIRVHIALDDLSNQIIGATIGGITVPAVHCQEDEVITWLGPDRLGCVHYEEVK